MGLIGDLDKLHAEGLPEPWALRSFAEYPTLRQLVIDAEAALAETRDELADTHYGAAAVLARADAVLAALREALGTEAT